MSAEVAKILRFPTETTTPTITAPPAWSVTGDNDKPILVRGVTYVDQGSKSTSGRIAIDELYSDVVVIRPELSAALTLLARGIQDLEIAVRDVESNAIAADDAVQRFEGLLPDLFNCRSLGDGFGAILSGIINGLRNRKGEFLSQSQIVALLDIVVRLRTEPFIGYNDAVDEIIQMEDQGLAVEPAEFETLADWLDE